MIIDAHAKIVDKTQWNDFIRFRIHSPEIAAKASPGQFLMVRISEGPHPLLRRPLCVHDRDGDRIAVFFQITGTGTTILSRKEKGASLDILGPLGVGFKIPSAVTGPAALVGGGRGIAPLVFLARELSSKGWPHRIYYGARSGEGLPLKDAWETPTLYCTTEDGSFGTPGIVTSLLKNHCSDEEIKPGIIFGCGPDLMLETLARLSRHFRIPAQLSLESIMGCGFGACWGCVKRMKKNGRSEWRKVCQDGPVVDAGRLVWSDDE